MGLFLWLLGLPRRLGSPLFMGINSVVRFFRTVQKYFLEQLFKVYLQVWESFNTIATLFVKSLEIV